VPGVETVVADITRLLLEPSVALPDGQELEFVRGTSTKASSVAARHHVR